MDATAVVGSRVDDDPKKTVCKSWSKRFALREEYGSSCVQPSSTGSTRVLVSFADFLRQQ